MFTFGRAPPGSAMGARRVLVLITLAAKSATAMRQAFSSDEVVTETSTSIAAGENLNVARAGLGPRRGRSADLNGQLEAEDEPEFHRTDAMSAFSVSAIARKVARTTA
eukprot:CAMPEP_0170261396 /NCGR_PEP_ID=MMETSP0116_2-20130129/30579_1 /TAXON_ID=400756 /ORGANISM="Durinskia baltica, Strain CSIRO CS-38" /LENGTH=107 /DNA_ID=CAMNT_0010512461 /DNA_START=6 /DNA_END=330 /DNA_ORIENTATION=+